MFLATLDVLPGYRVTKVLGLVSGVSVRAVHFGDDMAAMMKTAVGGEVHEYTKVFAEAREQSLDRMVENARRLGANAVIDIHFSTCQIANSAAELMAYGTAVTMEDCPM